MCENYWKGQCAHYVGGRCGRVSVRSSFNSCCFLVNRYEVMVAVWIRGDELKLIAIKWEHDWCSYIALT